MTIQMLLRPQPLPLPLPTSRAEIVAIQSKRKRIAFDRARTLPWYRGKLDHISPDLLDDPQVWQTIPILDKDTLRGLTDQQFYREFCVEAPEGVQEYWRSGGVTGAEAGRTDGCELGQDEREDGRVLKNPR